MAASEILSLVVRAKDETGAVLDKVSKQVEKTGMGFSAMKIGLVAAAAGFLAFGAAAVDAAADSEVAMAKLDTMLANTKGNTDGAKEAILKLADATVKLGFDDEDAALSLGEFYQKTKSLTEAQKLNALSMDLARAKGISLGEATKAVSMTMEGGGKVLKQYGIELKNNQSPMKALAELQTKVAGSADNFTKTFSGQLQIFQKEFGNITEDIGKAFLPMLTDMIKGMTPLIESFKSLIPVITAIGKAFIWVTEKAVGFLAALGKFITEGSAESIKASQNYEAAMFGFGNATTKTMYTVQGYSGAIKEAAATDQVLLQKVQQKTAAIDSSTLATSKYASAATSGYGGASTKVDEHKKKIEELNTRITDIKKAWTSAGDQIKTSLTKLNEDHKKYLGEMGDKIKGVRKELSDLQAEYTKNKQADAENVAKAIVDQEQKVADMQKQIADEKKKDNPDQERIADLQKNINKEQESAMKNSDFLKSISKELDQARKVASMSEIDRIIYEYQIKQEQAKHDFELKQAQYFEELTALQLQKDAENLIYEKAQKKLNDSREASKKLYLDSLKNQKEISDKLVDEMTAKFAAMEEAAKKAAEAVSKVSGKSSSSSSTGGSLIGALASSLAGGKAGGGNVRAGGKYRVGEFGPEYFIPTSNGRIESGNGGGGITVIVQGNTLLDSNAAEKIANMVIRQVGLNTTF